MMLLASCRDECTAARTTLSEIYTSSKSQSVCQVNKIYHIPWINSKVNVRDVPLRTLIWRINCIWLIICLTKFSYTDLDCCCREQRGLKAVLNSSSFSEQIFVCKFHWQSKQLKCFKQFVKVHEIAFVGNFYLKLNTVQD